MSPATEAQVKAVREAVLEAYGFALPDHAIRAMIETGLSHSASVVRTTASPLTVFDLTKPITATQALERRNEAEFAKRRLKERLARVLTRDVSAIDWPDWTDEALAVARELLLMLREPSEAVAEAYWNRLGCGRLTDDHRERAKERLGVMLDAFAREHGIEP